MQDTPAGKATLTDWHREVAAGFAAGMPEPLRSPANDPRPVRFRVAGAGLYTFAEMLAANAEDGDFRSWVKQARPGDVYEQMHAEPVECIAASPWPAPSAEAVTARNELQAMADQMKAKRAAMPRPAARVRELGPVVAPVPYPAPSCSEYSDWSRGMRQERVL